MSRSVENKDTADSKLYAQRQLCDVLNPQDVENTPGQVRACFASRIVSTTATRIKVAWLAQPHRLLDPPERAEATTDLAANTAADGTV